MRRTVDGLVAMALVLAVAVACSGCDSTRTPEARRATATPPVSPSALGSASVSPQSSPKPGASCADRALARMSVQQRVGQLFELGLAGDRLGLSAVAAIRADHLGSVWFVERSSAGTAAIRAVSVAVQSLATDPTTAGVRFFVAANQEGGNIQSLTGPGFSAVPSAVAQARMSPATLEGRAEVWGHQLRAAGVNLNFAPVMDVVPAGTDAQNQPIGALSREYGHDPNTVARDGVAFQRGMQAAGVATTAKHFPGLGRVLANTDLTARVVDRATTPDDPYLRAFRASIAARVPFVMVSLATYTRIDPNHLAVFSSEVIGQLLRRQLRFEGVVISDDLGAATAVAGVPPARRAIDFLLAGGDMVISKAVSPTRAMYHAVLSRTIAQPAFKTTVDRSVLRILQAKQATGLLPCA